MSRISLAAMAAVGLSGCDTVENVTDFFEPPIVLPCPDYRIVADAAVMVKFRDSGSQDLVDVEYDGRLGDLRLECTTHIDEETGRGHMDVQVTAWFFANRGPANKDRRAIYPYIISVTDLKRRILYREELQVAVDFPGNRTGFEFRGQPITLELPIRKGLTSQDYIIFGGFKLTRKQLKYNRLRRRQIGS